MAIEHHLAPDAELDAGAAKKLQSDALVVGSRLYEDFRRLQKLHADAALIALPVADHPADVIAHIVANMAEFGWHFEPVADQAQSGTLMARRLTPDERDQHTAKLLAVELLPRFRSMQEQFQGKAFHYVDVTSKPSAGVMNHLDEALAEHNLRLAQIFRDDMLRVAGVILELRTAPVPERAADGLPKLWVAK